jgi:hypothetical protein
MRRFAATVRDLLSYNPPVIEQYSFQGAGIASPDLSITRSYPITPTDGNLLIIDFGIQQNRTITPPAGWTQLSASSGQPTLRTFWKIAASETNSYTFTYNTTSTSANMHLLEISNFNTISPLNAFSVNSQTSATVIVTPDTPISEIKRNSLVLVSCASNLGSVKTFDSPVISLTNPATSTTTSMGYAIFTEKQTNIDFTINSGTARDLKARVIIINPV